MADKSNRDSNAPADEFAEGVKNIVGSRVANRAGSSSPPTTPLQYKLHQVCQQVCRSKQATPSGNRSNSRMGAVQTPRRSGPGSCSTSSESSGGYVTSKDKGKGPLTTVSAININSVPNGVLAGHPFRDIIVAMDNPLRVIGRKGEEEVISNSPGPSTTVGRGRSALAANGAICKAPKPKRIRPSKKPHTQIINVSKEEFRPVVQAITGCRQLPEAQLVSRQPERSQTERQQLERPQLERPQAERPQPERRQAERLEPVRPKLELQQPSEHKQSERQEPERPKAVQVSVGMVANPPARPDSSTSRIQAVPSCPPIMSSRIPEPTDPFDSCGSGSSSSLYQYTLCESNDSIYKAFGFPEGHRGILDDDLEQASDDGHSRKPVHEDGAGTSTPTAQLSFKALSVDDTDKKEDIQREHRFSGSAMAMPDCFPRSLFPKELNDVPDDYEMDRIFDEALICCDRYPFNPIYGFYGQ